jgi:hypothetical protein
MLNKLLSLVDEAHERAALGLFVSAWFLRLFAGFDDWATVAMFSLAAVTLLGQQRYAGISIGPNGVQVNANNADVVNVGLDEE